MSQRPLILVTNDDGVHAAGIKHLWKSLRHLADLVVVAPSQEQSAVGLSITVRRPLHIEKAEWPLLADSSSVWSVNGTPADCVKLALNVILPRFPSLIVSGINRGSNAGRNVLYSGTVAAVIEGILHDIPGIAFSVGDYFNPDYAEAENYIPPIVQYVLEHPLPTGSFLNVNFPKYKENGLNGIRFTRQGKEYWAENPEQREHPAEGISYYWLGSKLAEFEEEQDCDIAWLKKGYATAVPIDISNLTHDKHLEKHRTHFENMIQNSFFCHSTH